MKKGPTNPELNKVIDELKKTDKKIFLLIARKLATATRRRATVNLWKINKLSKEGDFVVVPGKVLSEGELEHKINLVAFNLSGRAKEKLKGKARMVSFSEMIKEKPKNMKVII